MPLCGGTGDAKDADEEIQALVDVIRDDLESKVGKKFEQFKALSYKSQVVAGSNYFVKIQVDDNDYVHARIYKPLPHTNQGPELHSYQVDKSADGEIQYF